jgi:MFS family permease
VPSPVNESTVATTSPTGLRLLPFYLGGFLGPFGTLVPVPMLPDLRDHFQVESATISWTMSAYLLPMAGLLLVSGTLGERFGRERMLRASLVLYLGASLLVAAAPNLTAFLAARALQGLGNAFFTPLLLAGLADITPETILGRRIGMYASFQAVGGAAAPFVGGLAAEFDWRLAFLASAGFTAVILVSAPRGGSTGSADRPPVRPLLSPRLLALGVASFASTAGPLGAQVLVGFKIRDVLDIDPGPAGLILAAGFIGPALLGPTFGRLTDRYGARLCGTLATLAVGTAVALLGPAGPTALVAALWLVAGSLFGFVTVVLHRVAAVIVPVNRGGALSAVLSFRFLGLAVGPLIWVPVFDRSVDGAFLGSALLGLVTIVALLAAVPRLHGSRQLLRS